MASFVLVHGGFHGGWCWERVQALLEDRGHEVEAPDLPGAGEDRTPDAEVTLASMGQRVAESAARCAEPAVVVGHSLGGIAVTSAAEIEPGSIARLVYLTAVMLRDGEVALSEEAEMFRDGTLTIDEAAGTIAIDPSRATHYFYGECATADAAAAVSRLTNPVPVGPWREPASADRGAELPRSFVKTLRDRTFPPAVQQYMIDACGVEDVHEVESDHSPFLSAPEQLAAILEAIAGQAAVPPR